MRNITVAFLMFIFSSGLFLVNGQETHQHNHKGKFNLEAFKQKKAEYIKKEVGLTDEEAKVFLPLMDELMLKKYELNKSARQDARALAQKTTKTEAEYETLVEKFIGNQEKEAQLEKEYYLKFKKILSAEKIYKFLVADRNFVKKVVHSKSNK